MISGSDREMAMSPKVLTGLSANTFTHVCPRLVDFHSPPEAVPTKTVEGSVGSASTSWIRPPVTAGPIDRGYMDDITSVVIAAWPLKDAAVNGDRNVHEKKKMVLACRRYLFLLGAGIADFFVTGLPLIL